MKIVKFIVDSAPYRDGDIAGFDSETAAALIKSGSAVAHESEAPKPEAKKK